MEANQGPGMSVDQFKAAHMKARISEVVGEYEEKLANSSLLLKVREQQLQETNRDLVAARTEIEVLTARLHELESDVGPEDHDATQGDPDSSDDKEDE